MCSRHSLNHGLVHPRIIVTDETDSYVVTDLESLTDYTFRIAAENAAGRGFSSAASTDACLHRLE